MNQHHPGTSPGANAYYQPDPPPSAYHQQPHIHPSPSSYHPPTAFSPQPHQQQHPGMHYAPPPPPPAQVFLGFHHRHNASVPMYGPPGAKFDWIGNVFVELPDGTKDWIGPYRNGFGYEMKNPRQRAEEDCCWTRFGMFHDDLYWK